MKNNSIDYSRYNSFDICQELKELKVVPDSLMKRVKEVLMNPKCTDKPFNERGLANLIYSLSKKKGVKLDVEFISMWQSAAVAGIRNFNSQDLANSIYAFGKLRKEPSLEFLTAWQNAAVDSIRNFNSQDLANSIYVFGVLGLKPSAEFLNAWQSAAVAGIRNFNSQELANSIYAFGVLGIKPSLEFLGAWQEAAIRSIGSFEPQGLANSIYAFGVLGLKPSAEFLNAWQSAAVAGIRNFNSQNLANSIYAFGVLGIKPSAKFLNAWQSAAVDGIRNFNSQDLANSIYAFGVLGIKPSAEFLNAWQSAAVAGIRNFNPQNLANSIYAFGVLGLKPSAEFLNAWQSSAEAGIRNFNSQDLANCIYALMLMQKVFDVRGFDNDKVMLFVNLLKSKADLSLEEKMVLGTALFVYCKEKINSPSSHVTKSEFQTKVYSSVKSLCPNVEEEKYFPEIGVSVDVYLEINGKKVVIQADGPIHYFDGTKEETPRTKFNTYLLEKYCGCEVLRIPFYEWDVLKSEKEKQDYLKGKIDKILGEKCVGVPKGLSAGSKEFAPSSRMKIESSTFVPSGSVVMSASSSTFVPSEQVNWGQVVMSNKYANPKSMDRAI